MKVVICSKHQIKSHKMKSNPNQITCFQIKSFVLKSNHHQWFDHDLNQIMLWICPSLLCASVTNLVLVDGRWRCSAAKVITGLAESNSSLCRQGMKKSPAGWLTACAPGSASSPTLINEYGRTLPYTGRHIRITMLIEVTDNDSPHLVISEHIIFYYYRHAVFNAKCGSVKWRSRKRIIIFVKLTATFYWCWPAYIRYTNNSLFYWTKEIRSAFVGDVVKNISVNCMFLRHGV